LSLTVCMPNKEKNSTKPKPSPASNARKLQQPVDVPTDPYRLKAEDIVPLSKEVNPSHIVVKDVNEIEFNKKEELNEQPPKPLKKSQFPPLSETKPDPTLPPGSAWDEPLPKELLQAPMKEENETKNQLKEEKKEKTKEMPVVPTKDGPLPKSQSQEIVNEGEGGVVPLKEKNSPRSAKPSPASNAPRRLQQSVDTKDDNNINKVKAEDIVVNPPHIIVKEYNEMESIKNDDEVNEQPLKKSQFPPLTETIPDPVLPLDSAWTEPLSKEVLQAPMKEESETKTQIKEEKKERPKEMPVVPTKDGPLPRDQLPEPEEIEIEEGEGEKVKDKIEAKSKDKIEENKNKMEENKNKMKTKVIIEVIKIEEVQPKKDKIEEAKEIVNETKEYVKEKAMDVAEKAGNVAEKIETKIEEGADTAKKELINLKDKTKEQLHNIKEITKDKLEDIKDATKDKIEDIKEATKEKLEVTKEKLEDLKEVTKEKIRRS